MATNTPPGLRAQTLPASHENHGASRMDEA